MQNWKSVHIVISINSVCFHLSQERINGPQGDVIAVETRGEKRQVHTG